MCDFIVCPIKPPVSPVLPIPGDSLSKSSPLAQQRQQSSGVFGITRCLDAFGSPHTYSARPHFLQESLWSVPGHLTSKACISKNSPLSQGSPFPDIFGLLALCSCLIGAFGPKVGRVPQPVDGKAWPDLSRQLLAHDSVTPALLSLLYGKQPGKLLKSSQWSLTHAPWQPE